MSLAPYLSPTQREETLERLAARAGADLVTYGRSVAGRPLRAAAIPASPSTRSEPRRVLCTANIHGPELISSLVALELLRRLGHPQGELARLRREAEVWVIPCLNPDGYARTWDRGGQGTLTELRANDHGVDLNRNFPIPHGGKAPDLPWAGSSRPGGPNYRGPAPLSEPESAALDALLGQQRFAAGVNLHSFMGTVIPARVTDRAAYRSYKALCRRFTAAQQHQRYLRLANRWFDVFTGELEDHQHHAHGCWAVCVETMTIRHSLAQNLFWAPSLFWRFNPREPGEWIDNDVPAITAFLLAALEDTATAHEVSRTGER
jgi:predicted deacylase